jgi:hypothetical protein
VNSRKNVKKLLRLVKRNGYVVNTGSKHYKVLDEDGAFLVGISRTPSDPLAWKRILADCRRAGVL